ncbi:hypothetical protein MHBO_003163 [Bonamia ostreae]|uniref:Structure-specific endonuclease subunit SLX4 n=1 Tax=Bonamia ostreae TaxID=126728 RepID=A0ABV2APP4_9EUKA
MADKKTEINCLKAKIRKMNSQIENLNKEKAIFVTKLNKLQNLSNQNNKKKSELSPVSFAIYRNEQISEIRSFSMLQLKEKMAENNLKISSKEAMVNLLIKIWDANHPDKSYTPSRWGLPPPNLLNTSAQKREMPSHNSPIKPQKLNFCSTSFDRSILKQNKNDKTEKTEIKKIEYFKMLKKHILSDDQLFEDILLFKTFEISDFVKKMKEKRANVHKKLILDYLDSCGVSYKTKRDTEWINRFNIE